MNGHVLVILVYAAHEQTLCKSSCPQMRLSTNPPFCEKNLSTEISCVNEQ